MFDFKVKKLSHEEIAEIAQKHGNPVELIAVNYNGAKWAIDNGYDKSKVTRIIEEKKAIATRKKKPARPWHEKHTRAEWEKAMELWQLMKKLNKLVK